MVICGEIQRLHCKLQSGVIANVRMAGICVDWKGQ